MNYLKAVFGRANLSGEQMRKVEAIVDEAAKTPNAKAQWPAPYQKLQEKVNGILTRNRRRT